MKNLILTILVFCSLSLVADTITFPSLDKLPITADKYIKYKDKNTPFIILFHQASWSRGEYLEIAPKLNNLGFNVLAVDLRSGDEVNGVENITSTEALELDLDMGYVDSLPDMLSSIDYVKKNLSNGKIIVWGSSYSSALVLKIAGDNSSLVDGVLAFSPGEYFVKYKKPTDWITSSATNIKVPVFITSAKGEKKYWKNIYNSIQSDKSNFLPSTKGSHGSRALWDKFSHSKSYWVAVKKFLKKFKE